MDIHSKGKWPARQLSNFALSPFEIDGIQCASMEGFIQSLKKKNREIQKHGCSLVGIKAKKWGSGTKWWKKPENQQLFWLGTPLKAHSKPHLELVYRALYAKFTQHDGSMRALIETGDATLTHNIGSNSNTSLKANDFCRMVMKVRNELFASMKKNT